MPAERWIEALERSGERLMSAADGEPLVDVPPLSAHLGLRQQGIRS